MTLHFTLMAVLAGAVVLFPSLRYLFRIFKSRERRGHDIEAVR